MDPLKFRIWNDGLNAMELVGAIDWLEDGTPITVNTKTKKFYAGINPLNIMQCTGIKDRNGVEIWEGDKILEYAKWYGEGSKHNQTKRVFTLVDIRQCSMFESADMSMFEIVGDIYEDKFPDKLSTLLF